MKYQWNMLQEKTCHLNNETDIGWYIFLMQV